MGNNFFPSPARERGFLFHGRLGSRFIGPATTHRRRRRRLPPTPVRRVDAVGQSNTCCHDHRTLAVRNLQMNSTTTSPLDSHPSNPHLRPPPIASPLGCVSTCAPDPKIDIRVYKATRITAPWCTRLHPVGGGGGVGLGERRTGTRRWPREMEQLVNGWGADDRIGRHRTRL